MNDKNFKILAIFLIIAALVFLAINLFAKKEVTNNYENQIDIVSQQNLFSSYIEENINEVSIEPAVLGGTFYVTNIEFLEDNIALVDYEDGHIALQAIISFILDEKEDLTITSFEIIDDESNYPIDYSQDNNNICIDQCGNGICEDIVCLGEGCPCPETPQSCPIDCA